MRLLFSFLLSLALATQAVAQGIEFFQGRWEEAIEEAKKQGKPIFVDAYAKWCGPCKRMAATTFKSAEAGEFFNKNFINVKLDAEEGDGIVFRRKYPVSAFPTLFFIDEKGEVLHKLVGAQDVKGLIEQGNLALRKVDFSKEYAAEYEKGNREPELIYNYVKSLNKSNKSSLKIANEYIRTQKDLTTEFNLRFLLEAAVEADSRLFTLLIENRKAIAKLEGEPAVADRIELACGNTVKKAIEFETPELLDEAKSKMKQHYPERSAAFAAKADLDYAKARKDAKAFGKACEDYVKKVVKDNPKDLNRIAEDIHTYFGGDEKCMKQAEKYAKDAAEKGNTHEFYYTYAAILLKNGKKKDALDAANKSLALTGEDATAKQSVEQLIKRIEG